jgi:hypothetical protein
MTQPLSQFEKPSAEGYKGKRKLFLVPNYVLPPGTPEEGMALVDRYWSEVRDAIGKLERSLGKISRVYHEMLYVKDDEALAMIQTLNPQGSAFIRALLGGSATLELTEDREVAEEHIDWQRILSLGLMSRKVSEVALDGYTSTLQKRFDKIAERIEKTLLEDESSVLFIREDHRVQFPSDIQVFYVAPPALDAMKRWMEYQMQAEKAASQPPETETETES